MEGHSYVVAVGPLSDVIGQPIPSPRWFARLRSGRALDRFEQPAAARYARIFHELRSAGIDPATLYESWEFTVGSNASLTQRMLGIRDAAFARLGDPDLDSGVVTGHAPSYAVTAQTPLPSGVTEVTGTMRVPCYLTSCGLTSNGGFHWSTRAVNAVPTQKPGQVVQAPFDCIVPPDASPATPARVGLYGHGFLSTAADVAELSQQQLAARFDIVLCSTDWLGLAYNDIGNDIFAMQNPNLLPAQVDRMQQGVLDMLYLGRLEVSPDGLADNPAFQRGGASVLDTSQLYYDGNSTGAIQGGIVAAVSPDVTRAAFGVSSMDWANWLIPRTDGIGGFATEQEAFYPDQSSWPLMLDLMQQIWDRGDPDGYIQHLINHRLPGTRPHAVLMQSAYGDLYVSMYSAVAEARTMGIPAHEPALDPSRAGDAGLLDGLAAIPGSPYSGSGLVLWDLGAGLVRAPPLLDLPPPARRTAPRQQSA